MEQVGAIARVQVWTRWLLLGPEDSWGATLGTGRLGIFLLAMCALFLHALDLATGLRMMLLYGVQLEQNPLARAIMQSGGPLLLVEFKLGVVLGAVLLFMRTAEAGRPRLARNCLITAVCIGMLGFASNLVG
jgi:hypothetical protein